MSGFVVLIVTLFLNFLSHLLFSILRALASLTLERTFDVLLISPKTSSMDRYLTSPNFEASRPRSNFLSHDLYYFLSASAPCHRRDAVHISSQLPPMHPISTTHEVPGPSTTAHAVPSPTTVCESPRRDDAIETALSQMSIILASLPAVFASLGSALRRPDTPQCTIRLPNDFPSRDAVPQPVPIPTQTSLLMPAATVDSAVAIAPGQRLPQPPPPAAPATTNPPPSSARPH